MPGPAPPEIYLAGDAGAVPGAPVVVQASRVVVVVTADAGLLYKMERFGVKQTKELAAAPIPFSEQFRPLLY
jgi:hypothetical protein